VVEPTIKDLFGRADGRIIISTFSSSVTRVQLIIDATHAAGRAPAASEPMTTIGFAPLDLATRAPFGISRWAHSAFADFVVTMTDELFRDDATLRRTDERTHNTVVSHLFVIDVERRLGVVDYCRNGDARAGAPDKVASGIRRRKSPTNRRRKYPCNGPGLITKWPMASRVAGGIPVNT